jgi:spore coat protein A
MAMNRRNFLKTTAMTGAAVAMYGAFGGQRAYAFYQSSGLGLTLWSQPLRGSDAVSLATQIGVAAPDAAAAEVTGATHFTLGIQQFTDTLHPALGPTTLWGFAPTNYLVAGPATPRHLGGIVVAQKGVPFQFTFRNTLPATHPIPVDITIPGANQAVNRAAVHIHGGLVPWISDGGPFDWWAPDGTHGASFLNNQVLRSTTPALNEAEYYYPNNQSARFLWYHDHAYGITRVNAYAGIATGYIIRDAFELSLGLPRIEAPVTGDPVPSAEIPIVIQDKIFVNAATIALDPTWTGPTTTGSLWYAHTYEKARWKLNGSNGGKVPVPDPSVIPEFFGDTMLANGTVYPRVAVEPKRYRIRFLNACNARFLNLQLYVADASANGITLNAATGVPTNAPGPSFRVLGTEAGFLQNPVDVPSNIPFNPVTLGGSLITGPAERWDMIIDFSTFAGQSLILYNDAPAPFPIGDPRNDYFPGWNVKGNPVNATTLAGQGPNTRELLRFDVGPAGSATSAGAPDIPVTTDLRAGIDPFLAPITAGVPIPPGGITTRQLTLNETFDAYGRLIQLEGTNVQLVKGTFGRAYTDAPTETPRAGTVEIWEIANLTGDTHPIHFHLVNVQVLNRQPFKVGQYNGVPSFLGPPVPPPATELGWKETVKMNPGEVTRVIMRFDLPAVPFTVPTSPRTGGNEYVWHCHILEHEEHDMMRPLVVI